MVTIPDWAAAGIFAILGGIGLFANTWIKATAEGSARRIFDKEIEKVKSDFRRGEERLKADLKHRESELRSLREGVLSGRANRMAMLDKRRLEAVERIWRAVGTLNRMKMPAMSLAALNLDVVAERAPKEPKLRESIKLMMGKIDFENPNDDLKVDFEQPFITPMAWALYSAFSSIIIGSWAIMKVISIGVDKPMAMIASDHTKNLIKAVLPHQTEYLDKFDKASYYHLLDEIENKLLDELRMMLEGVEVDEGSIRRAAEITEAARKVMSDADSVTAKASGAEVQTEQAATDESGMPAYLRGSGFAYDGPDYSGEPTTKA